MTGSVTPRFRTMPADQEITEQAYLIHRHFGDFDQFCENAAQWDLDYRQIEPGRFDSELLMAGSSRIQFVRARLGRRIVQKGAPPAGMRSFGLLAASNIRIFWRGRRVTGDDLFVFPVAGELDSVTQSDFDVVVVSLTEDTIASTCQSLALPDLDKLLNGNEVFRIDPEDMRQLRRLVLSTSNGLATNAGLVTVDGLGLVADELSMMLVRALSRGQRARGREPSRRRTRALKQVDAYLAEHATQPPRIEDLCRVANVSERTLEYAFREHYGLTPKAFINALRLNAARKALVLANPETSRVSEVVQPQGFWHMSQFAADYRSLFGELPSATLKRSI